jgi:secernin
MPKSCDTMVAIPGTTTDGRLIFAKNSDRPAIECQPLELRERRTHPAGSVTKCQFVELPEVSTTYRHIGSRPYWCWGYEHGFNEYQVVIGNEGLASRFAEFKQPKLIGMELIRLGLERGKTAAEAVEVMTGLITEYGQGKFKNDQNVRTYDNGYIIADPHEAYILQTAGHEWAVKRVNGAMGISNVYSVETDWDTLSPTAVDHAKAQGWWTDDSGRFNFSDAYSSQRDRSVGSGAMRLRRSCGVLHRDSGQVDVRTMMALLSDHSDGKNPDEPFQTEIPQGSSICVHHNADGGGGNTAASLVAHLCADGSQLPVYWCSLYSPCLAVFLPTFIEGNLPPVLGIGDEEPADDSPWWLFRRLSLSVRANGRTAISEVRAEWKNFQDRLFVSADQIATEGKTLIDVGHGDEAERLLTDYMASNVAEMLTTVRGMLAGLEVSVDIAAD